MASKKRKRGADALAEKEKKQKKVAAILLVVLLAAMAFSIPKTMKMMNQQPASATSAPVATTTPAAGATPAATGVDAGAAAVAAAGTPTLVTAETGGAAGQLISFERFPTKDPFVQQVGAVVPKSQGGSGAPTGATGATGATGVTPKPDAGPPAGPDGLTGGSTAVPGPGSGSSGGVTTTGSGPAPTPLPDDPSSAMISVNGGVPQAVGVEGTFPAVDPMFEVVELLPAGAKVAIVEGGYQSGDETITLTVGVPLTLQNTTDGTRYRLLLVSVG